MATPTTQRTIDHAEIAALCARVRERRLVEPDDYVLIDDLLGLASDLTVALARKQASLARVIAARWRQRAAMTRLVDDIRRCSI